MVDPDENKTEQEYIEMANHFRKIVDKKDEQIKRLSKNLCVIYGLVRATHENFNDGELLELCRTYCSSFIEEIIL